MDGIRVSPRMAYGAAILLFDEPKGLKNQNAVDLNRSEFPVSVQEIARLRQDFIFEVRIIGPRPMPEGI